MLRPALFSLLTINAAYLAWSQGWLAPLGLVPHNPSEPQRVQQQIRSDALQIERPTAAPTPVATAPVNPLVNTPPQAMPLPAAPTPPAVTTAPPVTAGTTGTPVAQAVSVTHTPLPVTQAITQTADPALNPPQPQPLLPPPQPASMAQAVQCLQSSPLDADQARALQNTLHSYRLPSGSWNLTAVSVPGRWMVYLGPFTSTAELEQRRAQLRSRGIEFAPAGGRFEPGLSLGRFTVREGAVRTLNAVQRQGLRDASLVQERPPTLAYVLRLPATTAEMRRQLQQLPPHTLGDRPLRPCP